jgi:hypothetical protein
MSRPFGLLTTICTHCCLPYREQCHCWKVSRTLTPHALPRTNERSWGVTMKSNSDRHQPVEDRKAAARTEEQLLGFFDYRAGCSSESPKRHNCVKCCAKQFPCKAALHLIEPLLARRRRLAAFLAGDHGLNVLDLLIAQVPRQRVALLPAQNVIQQLHRHLLMLPAGTAAFETQLFRRGSPKVPACLQALGAPLHIMCAAGG